MMKLSIQREQLLKPLQFVSGVVERRQIKPILSHVLLTVAGKQLALTGSDSEVELCGLVEIANPAQDKMAITVPGKKFLDICRALPEDSIIELSESNGRVQLASGKSRFVLTSLPAAEFPRTEQQESVIEFTTTKQILRELIAKTAFAIPQQDVRQYLNGLLVEIKDSLIQAIATDGHRLAISTAKLEINSSVVAQVIIPRKAVFELLRLLDDSNEKIIINLSNTYAHIECTDFILITRLISGKVPNYNRIIAKRKEYTVQLSLSLTSFKQALIRVGILSNELFRSAKFQLRSGLLTLITNNPEQEEAVEELVVDYKGNIIDTVFNIGYLMDILNSLSAEQVNISFKDSESGSIIEETGRVTECLYVLMPIR